MPGVKRRNDTYLYMYFFIYVFYFLGNNGWVIERIILTFVENIDKSQTIKQ